MMSQFKKQRWICYLPPITITQNLNYIPYKGVDNPEMRITMKEKIIRRIKFLIKM